MNTKRVGLFKSSITLLISAVLAVLFSGCGFFSAEKEPAVYISQSVINLVEGETAQLVAVSSNDETVMWMSGNEAVASVSESGLITANSAGESLITAMTSSALASCTVKVSGKTTDGDTTPVVPEEKDYFVISLDALELEVGKSVTLKAVTSASGEVEWVTSNEKVATVVNGTVTARSEGTAIIAAKVGKISAFCNVKVVYTQTGTPDDSYKEGYRLVWNDEFDGTSLDTTKWGYQTGTRDVYHGYDTQNWGWGNAELQSYTQDSVSVSNGSLVITATKQRTDDKDYKSGRILTRDLASWTYGYFEARIKTPTGNGMWPAFWMLPQPSSTANVNNIYGGWPYNGEIDIMEAKGRLENVVDTTLHYGPVSAGTWQSRYDTRQTLLSSNTDEWHTYAVEWTPTYISWIVDGNQAMRVSSNVWYTLSAAAEGRDSAPFDQPFYILLNLAVGGNYDSGVAPDDNFTSASMYVDYVRVYEAI